MKNYYDILGLDTSASQEEIKNAYRKLSLKFHPDKNDNDSFYASMFKQVHEAYTTLGDLTKRAIYDENLKQQSAKRLNFSTYAPDSPKYPVPKAKRKEVDVWKPVRRWRNIKRGLLCANILMAFLLFISSDIISNNQRQGVVIARKGVNVRESPASNAQILVTIPNNKKVFIIDDQGPEDFVLGQQGHWKKIKYKSYEGWVWGELIETDEREKASP
ncbi:DnaJ domain-containing protein [Fulvivirga maritima]|uniref:DnaJ domain-containing protein n=1 Tax=Fulvivirga maritima TaxID=2904247 RepID=UPI001F37C4D8|nr:DnaJ domain-containing protein [Fulvivirga maritima]UII26117.1 DnaJ domain-containing protein [Fulvivirga maritima]